MKRILIAAATLAIAASALTATSATSVAPAGGSYPVGCGGNGTAVSGGQMSYDGVSVTPNTIPAAGSPGVQICRDTNNQYYAVMIGLSNGTSLDEDLGATFGAKAYSVSFPIQSGDTTSIATAIGSMSEYSVTGGSAHVVVTPLTASTIFNGNHADTSCDSRPSDSSGNYLAACSVTNLPGGVASATGKGARFYVRFDRGWSNLSGMYVSASAEYAQVRLAGQCPTSSTSSGSYSGGDSGDGGVNRPSGLRADTEVALDVQLLGPHLTASGTQNDGTLTAVLPYATVEACFGASPDEMAQGFAMTRTEGGTTEPVTTGGSGGLKYTITPSASGLVISVPSVSFSQPTYNLKFTKTSATTGGAAETSSAGTIAGVKAKGGKGSATATFKKLSTVKSYAAQAQLATGKGAVKKGTCKVKGSKVSCTVKKLKKGAWSLQITSTLKAGGPGPSATKPVKVK